MSKLPQEALLLAALWVALGVLAQIALAAEQPAQSPVAQAELRVPAISVLGGGTFVDASQLGCWKLSIGCTCVAAPGGACVNCGQDPGTPGPGGRNCRMGILDCCTGGRPGPPPI